MYVYVTYASLQYVLQLKSLLCSFLHLLCSVLKEPLILLEFHCLWLVLLQLCHTILLTIKSWIKVLLRNSSSVFFRLIRVNYQIISVCILIWMNFLTDIMRSLSVWFVRFPAIWQCLGNDFLPPPPFTFL